MKQLLAVLITLLFICFFLGDTSAKSDVDVWPRPHLSNSGVDVAYINPLFFTITTNSSSVHLHKSIERYSKMLFPFPTNNSTEGAIQLTRLEIIVHHPDTPLDIKIKSSYELKIRHIRHSDRVEAVASITADNSYGAQYGLESFYQLVRPIKLHDLPTDKDNQGVFENKTSLPYRQHWQYSVADTPLLIQDVQRFYWRGLLLDTARHFYPIDSLYRLMDALSYVKMNVFHWHLSDHESFSIQLDKYPELMAAHFDENMFYSTSDIKNLVEYAADRGIVIVPELDTPSHCRSFSKAFPNSTVTCHSQTNKQSTFLNLGREETYELVESLETEIAKLFPYSKYFHIGGDEMFYDCYNETWAKESEPFITAHSENVTATAQRTFFQYFLNRNNEFVTSTLQKTPIIWQEYPQQQYVVDGNLIIQSWKYWQPYTRHALNAGYKTLMTENWYLDYDKDFASFYDTNSQTLNEYYLKSGPDLFLGGEACLWSETVNPMEFDTMIWPRTAAVAEKLWCSAVLTSSDARVQERLDKWACSVARRGIASRYLHPGMCLLPTFAQVPFVPKFSDVGQETHITFNWSPAFLKLRESILGGESANIPVIVPSGREDNSHQHGSNKREAPVQTSSNEEEENAHAHQHGGAAKPKVPVQTSSSEEVENAHQHGGAAKPKPPVQTSSSEEEENAHAHQHGGAAKPKAPVQTSSSEEEENAHAHQHGGAAKPQAAVQTSSSEDEENAHAHQHGGAKKPQTQDMVHNSNSFGETAKRSNGSVFLQVSFVLFLLSFIVILVMRFCKK